MDSTDSKIQFTLEIEKNGSLPFLDVQRIRNKLMHKLERFTENHTNLILQYHTAVKQLLNYREAAYRFYVR